MTNLYSIVREQFPEFIQSEYYAFLEFVQTYYKWLEIQSDGDISDIGKIDTTDNVIFIEQWFDGDEIDLSRFLHQIVYGTGNEAKAIVKQIVSGDGYHALYIRYITQDVIFQDGEVIEVLHDGVDGNNDVRARLLAEKSSATVPSRFISEFRKQLDTYGIFSNITPFNVRYLTNIKEIYAAKGSEQALEFLLKTVHGADITIRYPRDNILRASDGKWQQLKHIDVEVIIGTPDPSVKTVYIVDGDSRTPLTIDHCTQLQSNGVTRVRIFYYHDVPIAIGQLVQHIVDGASVCIARVIPTTSAVEVVDGGSGWQSGQLIVFPGSVKDTYARIDNISPTGAITHVEIVEYGFEHTHNQLIEVYPSAAENPAEKATLSLQANDAIGKQLGRWNSNKGLISNQEIRLQDSKYYQQFSYDIESSVNPLKYLESVGKLHAAGSKLYTTQILSNKIVFTPTISLSYPYRHISFLDSVTTDDSTISFELIRTIESGVTIQDVFTYSINKSDWADTVTATDGTTTTLTTAPYYETGYHEEGYYFVEKELYIT